LPCILFLSVKGKYRRWMTQQVRILTPYHSRKGMVANISIMGSGFTICVGEREGERERKRERERER
jgi:hypothetical protein